MKPCPLPLLRCANSCYCPRFGQRFAATAGRATHFCCVHDLEPTTRGSTHDYHLLKNECDVNPGLLDLCALLAALGYLGPVADYDLPPKACPAANPAAAQNAPTPP